MDGIRLKITKCHVNGNGFAYIKITSMQLRDYRPGIKFPDCLGAISQGGGDVWGVLNVNNDLNTHNVLPYATNRVIIGTENKQYQVVYSHFFYEDGIKIADKYLAKGTASTVVNQVVYNPVEMKKALTVPSVQGEKTTIAGDSISTYSLGGTKDGSTAMSDLTLVGFSSTSSTDNLYTTHIQQLTNGTFQIAQVHGGIRDGIIGAILSYSNGWKINNSPIVTAANLEQYMPNTQVWKLTSTTGTVTTINVYVH